MRPLVVLVLTALIALRVFEVARSRRNARRVLARGGRRVEPDGFAGIVLVHTLWLVGLALEEHFLGPASLPTSVRVASGSLALLSEVLRLACMVTLGERWNVRVLVLPGAPLERRGPYRFLRHPNYVAVVVQLVALPLALGLPWTGLGVLPLKLSALVPRLRAENAALGRPPDRW